VALVAAPLAAMLGWHRPRRRDLVVASLLVAFVMWGALAPSDEFGRFERAWVLVLGGAAVVALAIRPPAVVGILTTLLTAVVAAAVVTWALLWLTGSSWAEIQWQAAHHFGAQARIAIGTVAAATAGAGEAGTGLALGFESAALAAVRFVARHLAGLVMLQSLAAMAFAWAIYQRVALQPAGEPLPRLREFRFNDHLVWSVVLVMASLVIPGPSWIGELGANLGVFVGGLYVLRGAGVLAAYGSAARVGGPLAYVLGAIVALLLTPVVLLGTAAVGVTDTWLDWRRALEARKG
jgi:hypothetical protein